jgi:hypothetical protein
MISVSTSKSKFEGSCDELANSVFVCEDSSQNGNFEVTMDLLEHYVVDYYECHGDIRNHIKNMAQTIIPIQKIYLQFQHQQLHKQT